MAPSIKENELSKQYKKLLEKRNNLVNAIKLHEIKAKQIDLNTAQTLIQTRIEQLELSNERFIEIMQQLEDSDEFSNNHLEIPSVEVSDIYINAISTLKNFVKRPHEIMQLNSTLGNRAITQDIKFPRISIPNFSGDNPREWTSFYDAFSTLIDQNQTLTDYSKMHYLKGSLTLCAQSNCYLSLK